MSNFDKFISNILIEQPVPQQAQQTSQVSQTKDAATLYSDLLKKADKDIKDPGTSLVTTGKDLVENYLVAGGKQWNKQRYFRGITAKNRLDEVTAKYVDMGAKIFAQITKDTNNFVNDVQNSPQALVILQEFTNPNQSIAQYQCSDPILKNISEADNLAEIALSTFNNETIFNTVLKMLQQRAGKIKATINKGTLQAMLTYPAQYASGRTAIPEPLEKTLVESSMYNERLLAIGVAAIEYFKYLVNQTVTKLDQEKKAKKSLKKGPTMQQDSLQTFNNLVLNILNEFEVAGAQGHQRGSDGKITQFNPELRDPTTGRSLSIQQKYARSEMLNLTPFNLFDPKTWKRDSAFEKQYKNDYINFIVNGTAQSVPQKNEKEQPIIYNIGTISQDRSTQAQELIKALQGIAQFKRTKQTLMQRVGKVAGALGALRVGMGPVG